MRSAVDNSRKAAANYKKQLALRCAHDPVTSLTNELYALFMCHLMAGSETTVYAEKAARCADVTEGRWSFGNLDAHHAIFTGAG